MKKLYVLVFLIMFMGNMFSSDTAIFKDKDGRYNFSILIPNTEVGRARTSDRIILDNIPTKFVGGYKLIRTREKGHIGREINEQSGFKIDNKAKFDEIIAKQLSDINTLEDFVRSATSLKEYEIKQINFSDNPWDTLAPKAFAEQTGLTESDLKTSVFSNIGKTTEQKFILNLQKQLIKKAIDKSTTPETIPKLLGILSLSNERLPVGIGKTIDELQTKLSAELAKSKVKLPMLSQTEIYSFSRKHQPKPSEVPAQTQSTVDPRTEKSQLNILQAGLEKNPSKTMQLSQALKQSGRNTTVDPTTPKTAQSSIIQSKQITKPAKLASFRAQSPQRTQQEQAKAPTIIRTGSLKR